MCTFYDLLSRLALPVVTMAGSMSLAGAAIGGDPTDPAAGSGSEPSLHWSYRPVTRPDVPDVDNTDWPNTGIDRFVLARLEQVGLSPVDDADPAMLLRRVCFDLTGLPPTVEQLAEFLGRPGPRAFSAFVDRLLSTPEFGERWGQHWLNVARFAESSGGGRSLMFPQAWRYRDYVIASLNADKPFDRFIVEQLAGDLLPFDTPAQRDEQLIATGFLLLGPVNYELQDKDLLDMEVVDEQLDTVGRAFLGQTIGCARCHDHKFDPIPMSDYYGMAGIFTSTQSVTEGNVGRPMKVSLQSDPAEQQYRAYQAQLKKLNQELKKAERRQRQLQESAPAKPRPDAVPNKEDNGTAGANTDTSGGELEAIRHRVSALRDQLKTLRSKAPLQPLAMAVQDRPKPADAHLLIRGEIRKRGPRVSRCFLSAASAAGNDSGRSSVPAIPADQSGRLQLARWIASADNPLAPRVIVNRVWHHLMGSGLVRTTDDFGTRGERPSHPELLDYLASTFVDDCWSIKSLVRRIVLSRTYQLSSEPGRSHRQTDPDNRLLSHASRRRLDAEALRDAMLTVSGQLDRARGGLTIRKIADYDYGYTFDTCRRSVYVPRFRSAGFDMFEAFDAATPNVTTGRRNASILPTQALLMMNSPLVSNLSEHAARQLLGEASTDETRIRLLFRRALAREPHSDECAWAKRYLTRMREICEDADDADSSSELETWSGLVQLVFASLDFRYLN